jgi:hypothetical protein
VKTLQRKWDDYWRSTGLVGSARVVVPALHEGVIHFTLRARGQHAEVSEDGRTTTPPFLRVFAYGQRRIGVNDVNVALSLRSINFWCAMSTMSRNYHLLTVLKVIGRNLQGHDGRV